MLVLLHTGRNTATKPFGITGSLTNFNVTTTVYGNVPATPPASAPAPARAPASAPARAPAGAPASGPASAAASAPASAPDSAPESAPAPVAAPVPGPSSDLPCPCALPSGYNASSANLAGETGHCRQDGT